MARFPSSGGFARNPEIMFKATDPQILKDIDWARAPTDITIQFPPAATYDAETTRKMLKQKFGQRTPSELAGPRFRGLVMDQFAGQITPDVVSAMLKRRRAPVCIWGHLTPLIQVADRAQHAEFKRIYR